MTSKKIKKQQEELPSFLLNLNQIPSELKLPTKETSSDHYLGPLFFGGCFQHHPPHVIPRERLPPPIFTTISEQDILENMFVATSTDKRDSKTRKSVSQKRHRKRKSFEPLVARHRGVRKVFVPEVGPHEIDFGETDSEINGEMCREIPICRVTSCSSSISQQYEMVNLSDISEKNRPFMSYNERIAHSHFLKEFVTIKIIGPKIPAAITIKKLPTKRKRLSYFTFQLQSKKDEQEKVSGEEIKEDAVEEEENEEEEDEDSIGEFMKPISITEGLDDTLEDDEMETPSGMINKEDSQEESILGEDDGPAYDEEKDRESFYSDKQELETKEEGEEVLENERPTEPEVKEEE